jgi:cytochrome c peroxidase
MTEAKVALGRHLFFDKRLSANQKTSCATCHDPLLAFTDDDCVVPPDWLSRLDALLSAAGVPGGVRLSSPSFMTTTTRREDVACGL